MSEIVECFECGTLIDKYSVCLTCNPEYESGFQAGLKRAAELAAEKADYFHHTKREVKKAKGARAAEQAILKELSKDCSPSVSPED